MYFVLKHLIPHVRHQDFVVTNDLALINPTCKAIIHTSHLVDDGRVESTCTRMYPSHSVVSYQRLFSAFHHCAGGVVPAGHIDVEVDTIVDGKARLLVGDTATRTGLSYYSIPACKLELDGLHPLLVEKLTDICDKQLLVNGEFIHLTTER
jgi:hypothetical protein